MSDFGRRSNRSRKAVDYCKLDSVGSDDDDFKNLSPPTKRQKHKTGGETKTEKKRVDEVLKEIQTNGSSSIVKRKERVPVTEKVFERHLQAALELSTTSGTALKQELGEARKSEENVVASNEQQEVAASESNGTLVHDHIDGTEENSGGDFGSDASSRSDTEKNSEIKLENNERTIAKADEKQKRTQTTRVRQQTKVHQERTITAKPSLHVTLPSGAVKTHNTGLRLGLSRNVISKPLHPVVKARH